MTNPIKKILYECVLDIQKERKERKNQNLYERFGIKK